MRMLLLLTPGFVALTDPAPVLPPTIPGQALYIVGTIFSVGTLTAIISLIRDVIIERGKRKDAQESAAVTAQKDVREGESVREGEYRELAEQARKSAETAVNVIKSSLDATQTVVVQLQAVIESQNRTISSLTDASGEESELLRQARADLATTKSALAVAQAKATQEESERVRLEAELAEKDRDLELLDDLVHASVISHPARLSTGPIPTAKENA